MKKSQSHTKLNAKAVKAVKSGSPPASTRVTKAQRSRNGPASTSSSQVPTQRSEAGDATTAPTLNGSKGARTAQPQRRVFSGKMNGVGSPSNRVLQNGGPASPNNKTSAYKSR